MHGSLKILLATVLFLAACTGAANPLPDPTLEALYANPVQRPEFLTGIEQSQNDLVSAAPLICAYISQATLWEATDTADALQSHIISNTFFVIDGTQVRPEYASQVGGFALDEDGKATDKYYPPIEFCVSQPANPGLHSITITTSTTANEQRSYTWAINIQN